MIVDRLFDVLPLLAVVGLGLSGLEAVPTAMAAGAPHIHHPARAHHRHLAERNRLSSVLGAKAKRSGQNGLVRRGANGKQCRVRGETPTFSSSAPASTSIGPVTSIVAAEQPSTTQQPSTTEQASTTQVVVAVQSTTVVASAVDNAAAPSSTAPPPPPPASSSAAPAPSSAAPAPSPSAQSSQAPGGSSSYNAGSGGGDTNSGKKFGLGWPNGNWAQPSDPDYVGNYIGDKASWYYTWSPYSVGSADTLGLEFVPMLWGPKQLGDWYGQQSQWPAGVKNALFFNEPNEVSQCNIAASDSVGYWMNDYLPLRSKGIQLGGAATTSAPSGVQWVKDAISNCTAAGNSKADCTPDFIPIHWYYIDAPDFISYTEQFYQEVGIRLWVTEYACQNFNGGAQCSDSEVWSLHQTMADWFDKTDYVERYAPFGVMEQMQGVNQMNALMNPSGSITSLGNWYIWSS